jgi:hypothetical protein
MKSDDLLKAYDELDMDLYLKLADSLLSIVFTPTTVVY